jgi:hypothetical protein
MRTINDKWGWIIIPVGIVLTIILGSLDFIEAYCLIVAVCTIAGVESTTAEKLTLTKLAVIFFGVLVILPKNVAVNVVAILFIGALGCVAVLFVIFAIAHLVEEYKNL